MFSLTHKMEMCSLEIGLISTNFLGTNWTQISFTWSSWAFEHFPRCNCTLHDIWPGTSTQDLW